MLSRVQVPNAVMSGINQKRLLVLAVAARAVLISRKDNSGTTGRIKAAMDAWKDMVDSLRQLGLVEEEIIAQIRPIFAEAIGFHRILSGFLE